MQNVRKTILTLLAVAASFAIPSAAVFANTTRFDNGSTISSTDPYTSTQNIGDIYANGAVYGKLPALPTPVSIYNFTPSHDGEQTFTLEVPSSTAAGADPSLVLIDPTNNTPDSALGLPEPTTGGTYHDTLVTAVTGKTHTEPVLFQSYTVFATDHYKLSKGKTYYLIVLDQTGLTTNYDIRLGSGNAWTAKDFFTHFATWFRIKTDDYASNTPFNFKPATLGLLLFLLGFAALFGIWLIEQTFAFLANRMKTAGYLLIKLQQYSRIFIWVGLWFSLMGGYIYFSKVGWTGLPFILTLIYIIFFILQLVYTFTLSRRISKLEVTKQEATIPIGFRKLLYGYFVLTLLAYGGILVYLAMFLAHA